MNKKNITLILVGIILLTLQFNVHIGKIYFDIFNDIIAMVLIAIGGFPIAGRNVLFKKMRIMIVIGFILTVFGQIMNFVIAYSGGNNATNIITGLSTIANIYLTYYFTEGLILEAKFQEKSALTRSLRLIWAIYGILVFANFVAAMSGIPLIAIFVQVLSVIFAIYYCSSVLTACSHLYMDGLPTKHMDI